MPPAEYAQRACAHMRMRMSHVHVYMLLLVEEVVQAGVHEPSRR